MEKTKRTKNPVGRTAFLSDICCVPGQVGGCRIVARSSRGPEWVIVEWAGDNHNKPGDVDVVKLSNLDVR